MLLKTILNFYNLFLALGAFYAGGSMLLGKGAFDTFPSQWVGKLPFTNWAGIALFGIIIFGIGNAMASIYGFRRKDNKIFLFTTAMGALLFFSTVTSTMLVGEWYLPTGQLLILSLIQLSLGIFGFVISYFTNRVVA